MTTKSYLVKFSALIILVSLFGAACSQATPDEKEIVIGGEEAQQVQGADPTAPPTRTPSPAPTDTPTLEPSISPSPTSTLPPFEQHLN
ncbi:MAG TPA: hypothetical protein VMV80_04710, partial [Anaerolineales bacterium]|nr:hypothetical protein [Anaerolineales bacterium]